MGPEIVLFVIIASCAGAALGTFTGIVPGIHVNVLAAGMAAALPAMDRLLSGVFPSGQIPILVAACVVSAAVVHSFTDCVPSVFLGAPDPDEVLNMLPGHRMLMEGRGMAAVRSAAIGSLVGSVSALAAAVPLQFLISLGLGGYLESITLVVLAAVIAVLVSGERGEGTVWAGALTVASGILGCIGMLSPGPSGPVPGGSYLFPLLTGLFGMPAMILSAGNGDLPEQDDAEPYPVDHVPGIKGAVTGALVGWFPGVTATAGAVLSGTVSPEKDAARFISVVSSVGSASTVMALVTLSMTGKGRTGAMIAVGEVLGGSVSGAANETFLLMMLSVATATLLGYVATVSAGRMFADTLAGRDLSKVNKAVMAAMVSLVALTTGVPGILMLAAATALGLVPSAVSVGRVHLTGCLTVPVILLYAGVI